MNALLELAGLLADDWRVRAHRALADWHHQRMAAACEARRQRIARWTGRL